MQAFVMLFLVVATLVSNVVYSLPAVNFTDTALSNQMIKTLSEALLNQGEQQQQHVRVDSRGFYYPYPYQNVNWYNFPYLWPAVARGLLDPTAPLAGLGAQLTGLGTGGCPTGLCPSGASCSQLAGQWQCGCGLNSCNGSKTLFIYLFVNY
ncbi:unnamed protein product [Rotaria socialis]|uniref:Uncharacterized protein n=1 Tax=Rotaria socialis TaxID=392032 RepID=A0A820PXW6_9BILA|nr:unnamed protein product [Rotaria socialis]CAF4412288.1 unnamed protein product [Rotaria socialis]